ncbi:MAG: hypothetical protein JWP97_5248 [Labilithrix sp.]|nr:hypothetical protein [Labilithrix sp.]
MKRTSSTLAVSFAFTGLVAALAEGTASAQEANGFGEKGQLIVTADRLMPLLGYSRESVDRTQNNNVDVTESDSSVSVALLIGREPSITVNPHTIPRIAFDYAVIPHLTIGGALVLGLGLGGSHKVVTTTNGSEATQSSDAPTVTALGIAPRVGYVLPLTSTLAFWPRAGFAFYSLSSKSTADDGKGKTSSSRTTDTALSLDLDPQFVFAPMQHFFFHAGPIANIPLTGKRSTTTSEGGTAVEVSNDLHIFHIGLSAGLGGWFDL